MAYVGISRELRREIQRVVTRMKEAEKERLTQALHPLSTRVLTGAEWAQRIEAAAWDKHAQLRATLPEEWLVATPRIDVHFMRDAASVESVRYEAPPTLVLPPSYKTDYIGDVNLPLAGLGEFGEQLTRYHVAIEANEERFTLVWGSIDTLLQRCKSLNEAVELFPDLRFFLDDGVKTRLDEKRGRKQSEPDTRLVGIDTALITAAAVLGKMNEGNR